MKIPAFIFLTILFLNISAAKAQDPALSQFFANRSYLTPAFTGIERGIQFTASARNQWFASDKGYSFASTTIEWQEPCWNSGFGFTLRHASEGLAPLKSSGAEFAYAYIPKFNNGTLHVAVKYAFNQKKLDWSKLTFSDELDPVFGDIYPSIMDANTRETIYYHDFSMGGLWRWNSRFLSARSSNRRFRSHIGLAFHHLGSLLHKNEVGPNESLLNQYAEVPARITLHAGTILVFESVKRQFAISPNVRFESQGPNPFNPTKSLTLFSGGVYFIFLNQFTLGTLFHSKSPVANGRHTNAVSGSFGFSSQPKDNKKDSFYLGLSVDANITGLGFQSKPVFELNFRYSLRNASTFCSKVKSPVIFTPDSPSSVGDCPVFEY